MIAISRRGESGELGTEYPTIEDDGSVGAKA